jgi:tRNA dimethylallyltransferase
MPINLIDQAKEILQFSPAEFAVIVGPTCTGKTALAIELAEFFQVPIINADSRLIFQEMNIGTAKPSDLELNLVPHYLVNIKKPNETYSAGEFQKDFDQVANSLPNRLNQPKAIIVGGTGLYIKSALESLLMPSISPDPDLRAKFADYDLPNLQKHLQDLDPDAQNHIDIQNKIRIIRAIEIITYSGQPLKQSRQLATEPRYQVAYIGLNFADRAYLYSLIDTRVLAMFDQGLLAEVQTLLDKYGPSQTLKSTIGYKEVLEHLSGKLSIDEAISLIQKNTRNYAKRQMTWFKANSSIKWFYK